VYRSPRDGREGKAKRLILFYSGILLVIFADQLTKYLSIRFLSGADTYPVFQNIFHLTLVRNSGIAFGLFRNSPEILLIFISASIMLLMLWGQQLCGTSRLAGSAFALIVGGAVGNWIDRLRFGAVIDFLDFRVWPVFNLADSMITVGIGIYLISFLKSGKHRS